MQAACSVLLSKHHQQFEGKTLAGISHPSAVLSLRQRLQCLKYTKKTLIVQLSTPESRGTISALCYDEIGHMKNCDKNIQQTKKFTSSFLFSMLWVLMCKSIHLIVLYKSKEVLKRFFTRNHSTWGHCLSMCSSFSLPHGGESWQLCSKPDLCLSKWNHFFVFISIFYFTYDNAENRTIYKNTRA